MPFATTGPTISAMNKATMMTAALLLAACTASPNYLRDYSPQAGAPSGTRDELYQRAMTAVADAGLTIETNDPAAGLVLTSWECGGMCNAKYRFRVSVQDQSYDVAILCEGECNEGLRPQGMLDTQAAIAASMER